MVSPEASRSPVAGAAAAEDAATSSSAAEDAAAEDAASVSSAAEEAAAEDAAAEDAAALEAALLLAEDPPHPASIPAAIATVSNVPITLFFIITFPPLGCFTETYVPAHVVFYHSAVLSGMVKFFDFGYFIGKPLVDFADKVP